eukprot:TRINITY_DN8855_c0_g1_i1.p1 TRINITY_DN8855_c0_g1~~TRINITY_DN8855_c0_g1_i1.p1  ORF type:complete len:480 (+),score=45.48 TRINITY_DN8855_c0_g1_i1:305-1744(+)
MHPSPLAPARHLHNNTVKLTRSSPRPPLSLPLPLPFPAHRHPCLPACLAPTPSRFLLMDITACFVDTGSTCVIEVDVEETLLSLKHRLTRDMQGGDAPEDMVPSRWFLRLRGSTEELQASDDTALSQLALEAGSVLEIGRKQRTGIKGKVTYNCDAPVLRLCVSACGMWCVLGLANNTAEVWDTVKAERVGVLEVGCRTAGKVWGVAISQCAGLIVTGGSDAMLRVWSRDVSESGHHVLSGHTRCVNNVVITSCNRCIVSSSDDGTIRVWGLSTGDCKRTIRCSSGWVKCAVSPCSTRIVSSDHKGVLALYDLDTGDCVRSSSLGIISKSHVIPQGCDSVICGCADGTIRTWDLSTGRVVSRLSAHAEEVKCLSLSACSRWLVSADEVGTKEWDLHFGQCVAALEYESCHKRSIRSRSRPLNKAPRTSRVTSLSVSPCGRWIFRASQGLSVPKPGQQAAVDVLTATWSVSGTKSQRGVI